MCTQQTVTPMGTCVRGEDKLLSQAVLTVCNLSVNVLGSPFLFSDCSSTQLEANAKLFRTMQRRKK